MFFLRPYRSSSQQPLLINIQLDRRIHDLPIALIRHNRRLLEKLLPLFRQRRQRELRILRRSRANLNFAIGRDSRQDSIITSSTFNTESRLLDNGVGVNESLELGIVLRSFAGFLNGAGKLGRQVGPGVVVG
jgi:hypothetical protein